MVTLDGRFLDRAVHALDLTIGPRMLDLGHPMFDAILLAAQIEHMCRVSCRRAVRVCGKENTMMNGLLADITAVTSKPPTTKFCLKETGFIRRKNIIAPNGPIPVSKVR